MCATNRILKLFPLVFCDLALATVLILYQIQIVSKISRSSDPPASAYFTLASLLDFSDQIELSRRLLNSPSETCSHLSPRRISTKLVVLLQSNSAHRRFLVVAGRSPPRSSS
ncbi:hypothetical protein L596_007570 [Steinernema carpocapsae]|uniref:Uncharacterized protein n=1 Tax=Steinernema carpocapsae TaxID=34508 RepID=A0A4U5P9T4_STECR|nr:hypothetical protein L596_007570 [Steinernema carpocapsae]